MQKTIKKRNLLIVDFSNIVCRNIFVHKRLTSKGKFTGGLYGFTNNLLTSCEEFDITNVVIALDSKPYIKSEQYIDYKSNRQKDEEFIMKLSQSTSLIKEMLGILDIQAIVIKGHEADDIIAQLVINNYLSFKSIIINSNDDDLFQLLKNNVYLNRGKTLVSKNSFIEEYELQPNQWIDVISLKGSHNNVKGIKGVGIKTALKIVKDQLLFDKYYIDHKDLIDRNRKLVKLPYIKLPSMKLKHPVVFDKSNLILFLEKYGMRNININKFERCLKNIY